MKTSYTGKRRFLDLYYGANYNEDGKIAFSRDELFLLLDKKLVEEMEEAIYDDKNGQIPNIFVFDCVKRAYLAIKLNRFDEFMQIYNAASAYDANKMVKKMHTRKDLKWMQEDLMRYCIEKKFEQHPELLKELLLCEESLSYKSIYADYFFGLKVNEEGKVIGGKDTLGKIYRATKQKYLPKEMYTFSNKYDRTVAEFEEKIKGREFFIIDTETNGFRTEDGIIELSAIKVNGDTFEIIDEYDEFINPGKPLTKDILKFNEMNGTGINQELIDEVGLSEKEALEGFNKFLGKEKVIIVGHNFDGFDKRMLNGLYERNNQVFEYDMTLDTLKIAKDHLSGSHKLGDIFASIPDRPLNVTLHRSIDDIKANLVVLQHLLDVAKKDQVYGYNLVLNRKPKFNTVPMIYDKNTNTFVSNSIVIYTQDNKKYKTVDVLNLLDDITQLIEDHPDSNIFIPFMENKKVKSMFGLSNNQTRLILDQMGKNHLYSDNLQFYNFKKVGGTFPHINENFTINSKDLLEKYNFLEEESEVADDRSL